MSVKKIWYEITRIFKSDEPVNWKYEKCITCKSYSCGYARNPNYKHLKACGLYEGEWV